MRMQLEEDMFSDEEEQIYHIMRFRGCSYESAKMEFDAVNDKEEDWSDEN